MGADIHCSIEYGRTRTDPDGSNEKIWWSPFNYGPINPGRDYDIFGLIAGVRRSGQLFQLRGIPDDAAYGATSATRLYVVDDKDANSEGCCSRADAESWVASGCSKWTDDKKNQVTHPDWHSHTWLTPAEWRQVIEHPSVARQEYPVDASYFAMAAAMEEYERQGYLARVIIWFDN